MTEPGRRRRHRSGRTPAGAADREAATAGRGARPADRAAGAAGREAGAVAAAGPGGSGPDGEGLRGLVGSGASQLSLTAAMRARDAARPTGADLAAAEAAVVLVRRHWTPAGEGGGSG